MTTLEINYERIRDCSEVIQPEPFKSHDQDGIPTGYPSLWNVDFGSRVRDRKGQRFLLMGYGACQGDVVLRDRYRRMFYADGNMRMEVVDT